MRRLWCIQTKPRKSKKKKMAEKRRGGNCLRGRASVRAARALRLVDEFMPKKKNTPVMTEGCAGDAGHVGV
jgi:hypothetical protein